MIRDHGSERKYYHDLMGFNARLDELQAVVLRSKLPHLEMWNEKRREHARRFNQLLQGTSVITPTECPENRHIYHLYVVRAPKRDELQIWLRRQGIFTGIHYPVPIHLQQSMQSLGYKQGDLPVTERVVTEILSLPMYAELTDEQVVNVVDAIRAFYA